MGQVSVFWNDKRFKSSFPISHMIIEWFMECPWRLSEELGLDGASCVCKRGKFASWVRDGTSSTRQVSIPSNGFRSYPIPFRRIWLIRLPNHIKLRNSNGRRWAALLTRSTRVVGLFTNSLRRRNRGLRTDREDCQRFSSRRLFLLSFRLPIAFNAAPFILRWLPSSFPLPDSSICDVSSLLRFGALYCLTISQHLLFLFLYSLQLFSCIYLLLVSVSQVTSTELILYFLPPCRCWWWLQNNHPFFKHVLIQGPSVTLLFLWIQPLCRLMIRRSSVITLCFKVKSVPMSASEGQEDDILDLVAFALKDDFILLYLSH